MQAAGVLWGISGHGSAGGRWENHRHRAAGKIGARCGRGLSEISGGRPGGGSKTIRATGRPGDFREILANRRLGVFRKIEARGGRGRPGVFEKFRAGGRVTSVTFGPRAGRGTSRRISPPGGWTSLRKSVRGAAGGFGEVSGGGPGGFGKSRAAGRLGDFWNVLANGRLGVL